MDIFDEIVSRFKKLEDEKITLSNLARKYNFEEIEKKDDSVPGEYYYLYYGEKKIDDFLLVIEVETKDKYKSFGDDDEPYRNTIKILKNNKVINEEYYIFFN